MRYSFFRGSIYLDTQKKMIGMNDEHEEHTYYFTNLDSLFNHLKDVYEESRCAYEKDKQEERL